MISNHEWIQVKHPVLNGNVIDFTYNLARVYKQGSAYVLTVNDERWLIYDYERHSTERQFSSSYDVAYGDCVLSGLGLGILPEMLMNKPEVKSITVYESNKDVIEINKLIGFDSIKKINIIHDKIENVQGIKCDCLLLDHYEFESDEYILNNVKQINDAIQPKVVWFWRAETTAYNAYLDRKLGSNISDFGEMYQAWKKQSGISNLPDLDKNKIDFYLSSHYA